MISAYPDIAIAQELVLIPAVALGVIQGSV